MKKKLAEFLEVTKSIHDIQAEGVSWEDINELNEINADCIRQSLFAVSQVFNVQRNRQKFSIIELGTIDTFRIVPPNTETMDTLYTIANGQSQNTYIPLQVIGISAKSKNTTAAEKSIKYYLQTEAQSIKVEEGLPVNITAFDEIGAYDVELEKQNKENPQEELAGAGETMLEEAITAILKKINIYLAE